MSTIRVNTLQNTSTTDGGISINNSGHVTVDGVAMPSAGPLSNRNLIINGAMQVAQRATSNSISDGANEGYRTLDRWYVQFSSAAGGVATMSQDTDVPSTSDTTFRKSLKIDVTTAATSPATNHAITLQNRLESQVVLDSGWDYTDANSFVTLSFWAKSVKAGTYCCWFYATDNTAYTHVKEYTLAANTWTYVTLSFPGNSNLSFNDVTTSGLIVGWTLVAGTDRHISADTWTQIGTRYGTSNQVNFFDSTDNNFWLTGVQLEVGSVATPFEHRSYGDELARCQRYFLRLIDATTGVDGGFVNCANYTSTNAYGALMFPTTMRTGPSLSYDSSNVMYLSNATNDSSITLTIGGSSVTHCEFIVGGFSMTSGHAGWVRIENTGHVSFSAEI